jgi:Tol biopolymer transport system component
MKIMNRYKILFNHIVLILLIQLPLWSQTLDFKQLTHDGKSKAHPMWSPDGYYIAYIEHEYIKSEKKEIYDIIAFDPARSVTIKITDTKTGKAAMSWSPDGREIVYSSYDSKEKKNVLLKVPFMPFGKPEKIKNIKDSSSFPSWSPDGTRIVFAKTTRLDTRDRILKKSQLYLLDMFDSHIKQLTFDEDINIFPTWSPDGTQLAFLKIFSHPIGKYENLNIRTICIFNLSDEEKYRPIFVSDELMFGPISWSPDGKYIAFDSYEDIWVISSNGKFKEKILDGTPNSASYGVPLFYSPSWSPDGKKIVCVGSKYEGKDLYIIDVPEIYH